MNVEEVVNQLSVFVEGELPKEALLTAKANWSKVFPHVNALATQFITDESSLSEAESYFLFYGLFLLVEQKANALPLLINIVDRDDCIGSALDALLGDSLTESLPSFLYILAAGQSKPLINLVLSGKAGSYVVVASMQALFAQFENRDVDKATLYALINTWLTHFNLSHSFKTGHVLSALADLCINYGFDDFKDAFLVLAKEDKLDSDYINVYEVNAWQTRPNNTAIASGLIQKEIDVVTDLAKWDAYSGKVEADFGQDFGSEFEINDVFSQVSAELVANGTILENATSKVLKQSKAADTFVADVKLGRNDPCHCGSGKKHKKCCGLN